MNTPAESAGEVRHPIFARLYRSLPQAPEEQYRRELLAGLAGTVIEVGAGHGPNFEFYPAAVERVLAVEPEPSMRHAAEEAATEAPVPIEVVDGVAEALPVVDGAFDVAIASLMLCSVANQAAALGEMHRVVRPGGELRFYEHVVAERPRVARLQRLADRTLWPRLAGGCHMARDTVSAIEQAGFTVESRRRFTPSPGVPLPHVLGIARRN